MSELTTLRKKKTQKYYSVDLRVIESPNLSWEAKGLWAYLISRPDGWTVNRKDLLLRAKNGEASLRNILKEIQMFGLLEIRKKKNGSKFAGTEWIVTEDLDDIDSPYVELPCVGFPHAENPHAENPHVENPRVENPHDIEERILEETILEKTKLEETTTTHAQNNFSQDQDRPTHAQELIAKMLALESLGSPLNRSQAERFCQNYGLEACRNQLDWLPYHNPRNPVAVFQAALRDNLPAPKSWLEHQAEAQKRKKAEEQAAMLRAERESQREAEKEIRAQIAAEKAAFNALSPEEQQTILAERERKRRENSPFEKFRAERKDLVARLQTGQVPNLNTCPLEAST